METGLTIIGLICLAVLMFKRWFWLIVLGTGSVASFFALLDSAVHFKIPGTIGFFCLMLICWSFARVIAGGYPKPDENMPQDAVLPSRTDNPDWSPP